MTLFDFKDIHSHTPGADRVLSIDVTVPEDLQRLTDGQYFTAGVHPWHADREFNITLLERLLESPYCVGIGECGLDRRRGPAADVQEHAFRQQLDIAERLNLPVVIHAVDCIDRLLALRKEYGQKVPWIVHGFRGKVATARQLISAGIHISIGEKYNPGIIDAVPGAFLHHETD